MSLKMTVLVLVFDKYASNIVGNTCSPLLLLQIAFSIGRWGRPRDALNGVRYQISILQSTRIVINVFLSAIEKHQIINGIGPC